MRYANVLLAFVTPFAIVPFGIAGAADATATSDYAVLHDDFAQLREDFNRAKGSVRLLFVVDPVIGAKAKNVAPAAPEVEWSDTAIPQPELLMHQLWKLEGTKFPKLDSAIFAREVHNRLQALSASTVTPK